MDRAEAIVLRTTDWSETSRIATLWTREFGKVRALAKGGRRLRSSYESALDLLNVCSIVLLRKSTGGLDLLTEARVSHRFPSLRAELGCLYAGYYVAELLADWTEDHDPHPALFDEAVATLGLLGGGTPTGLVVMRFEMSLLRETGYRPTLDQCAACAGPLAPGVERAGLCFSPAAGGVLCPSCRGSTSVRDRRDLSDRGWRLLQALAAGGELWRGPWPDESRAEVRRVMGGFVTWVRGRQPRLLPYLTG